MSSCKVFTANENIEDMGHEGERIKRLLSAIGKTPADFARACNVTRTAVDRYLKAEEIGKNAWHTVRVGLVKLGIDPRKVRPEDQMSEEIDLRPLVHGFDRDQLERVRRILDADTVSREKLSYYIDGILLTVSNRR